MIYKCKTFITDIQDDRYFTKSESKATAYAKNLKSAIEHSFRKNALGSICETIRYLPADPEMQGEWSSYDMDEKFHAADCSYVCEEDSI